VSQQLCLFEEEDLAPTEPAERFEVNFGFGVTREFPDEKAVERGLLETFPDLASHKIQDPNPQYAFAFMSGGSVVARVRRLTG